MCVCVCVRERESVCECECVVAEGYTESRLTPRSALADLESKLEMLRYFTTRNYSTVLLLVG